MQLELLSPGRKYSIGNSGGNFLATAVLSRTLLSAEMANIQHDRVTRCGKQRISVQDFLVRILRLDSTEHRPSGSHCLQILFIRNRV